MKNKKRYNGIYSTEYEGIIIHDKKTKKCLTQTEIIEILNKQDYTITELLYKLKKYGKNINHCEKCEYYITKIKYCWMYDMEVYPYDIVTECEHYKKKIKQKTKKKHIKT